MRVFVRLIDYLLRISLGVVEPKNSPGCILRIQLTHTTHPVSFAGQTVLKGDPILALHAWNERMPKIPSEGASLEWAIQLRRQVIHSFGVVARLMQEDRRYSKVKAVCGTSALFSFSEHTGGTRLMEHLGFAVLPYHRPAGRFGEFWENLFSWWLMWTYNQTSLQSRQFLRLQRTEIWITTSEFIRRYGKPGED